MTDSQSPFPSTTRFMTQIAHALDKGFALSLVYGEEENHGYVFCDYPMTEVPGQVKRAKDKVRRIKRISTPPTQFAVVNGLGETLNAFLAALAETAMKWDLEFVETIHDDKEIAIAVQSRFVSFTNPVFVSLSEAMERLLPTSKWGTNVTDGGWDCVFVTLLEGTVSITIMSTPLDE